MTSRRDFIRTIILGSGAVYAASLGACDRPRDVYRLATAHDRPVRTAAQRFQDAHAYLRDHGARAAVSREQQCDVVVVGGGLSGLTATHILRKEGRHVLCLEHESRAGGVGVATPFHGLASPLGSIYFIDRSDTMMSLVDAAGATPIVCPPDGYVVDGTLYRDIWTDKGLSALPTSSDERSILRRFRDDLVAMGDALPSYPLSATMPDTWKALDAMSGEEYLRSYPSPLLHSILDAYARSSMGASLRETNAFCLLNFYASEFELGPEPERFTFEHGMSGLTSGLAASMADSIRTSELVVRVANTASGVDVYSVDADGRMTRTSARTAILATQKFMAPLIVEGLPSQQVQAMRSIQYAPYMTVHVQSSEPLVDASILDTWFLPASPFFSDVINPSTIASSRSTGYSYSLFAPLQRSLRASLQDEEQVVRRAARTVDAALTMAGRTAESITDVYAWTWGHSLVLPTVGSHQGAAQTARMPFGNCMFANTDNDASPSVESSISSALEAVDGTLRVLGRSAIRH